MDGQGASEDDYEAALDVQDNSEEDFGIWMLRTKDHQVLKNMVKPLPHGILEVLEKGDNCTKYSLQGVPEYC